MARHRIGFGSDGDECDSDDGPSEDIVGTVEGLGGDSDGTVPRPCPACGNDSAILQWHGELRLLCVMCQSCGYSWTEPPAGKVRGAAAPKAKRKR